MIKLNFLNFLERSFIFYTLHFKLQLAQLAGAVEYTNSISGEV